MSSNEENNLENKQNNLGVFRKLQTPPEIMRKLPISGENLDNNDNYFNNCNFFYIIEIIFFIVIVLIILIIKYMAWKKGHLNEL